MSETGVLLRAVSSFYEVHTHEGNVLCRARGKLRLHDTEPLPGDIVDIEREKNRRQTGVIHGIHERKNWFIRPNIANVDQFVFVASAARPKTDTLSVDRIAAVAEAAGCSFLICVNKCDLESADAFEQNYRASGIPVLSCSALTGMGINELQSCLKGRCSVLTGNSGVGKTSLLNGLFPNLGRKTGEISEKHGRGKHTTRHTELILLEEGGWIADSPGFAALDLSALCSIKAGELSGYFHEFPKQMCRFDDCLHRAEPGCAVKKAVENGTVPLNRYQTYLRMLNELENPERS